MNEAQVLNDYLTAYLSSNPWSIPLLIWVTIWKALALWQAARRDKKIWFIAITVVQTLGVLEIVYLVYLYITDKKNKNLQ